MNTVLDGLAQNPALPATLLTRLVAVADGVLAQSLARRSDLTASHVLALLDRGDPDVVGALLEAGWVRPADVPVSDVWVALVVAEHPDAPPSLVRWLAAHPDPVVRARLGVALLRERPDPGARVVADSELDPDLSPDLLHGVAERAEEVEVLRAIARHPNASGATLLLCLEDAQARYWAACHPNLPVEKIVELLGSEFTARPAASNPSLPVSVMEELLNSTT